ncbi:Uncharacterised protein [Escherichia coli]|uniref:Uncharacterized protein n=1 Tax=Escherichia coli TaxID=562 RepID=A0A376KY42_ECOLX|nr:Uncharacterised protein [Escherichia coli]
MSQAKSKQNGRRSVNHTDDGQQWMGSGIIMLPTKLAEVGNNFNYLLAGDSRRLNGTGMGIRKMRYVQP